VAKGSEKQDACSIQCSALPPLLDPQRAGSADRILQQLEAHHIPDREIVERGAVLEVAAMEIDDAAVGETDETVALPDQELYDAASRHGATSLRRPP
jgi:hypothetical protein